MDIVELDYANYPPEGTVNVEFNGEDIAHVIEASELIITERERKEIELCLFYATKLAHGTDGHNAKMLMAKMARALGIEITKEGLIISAIFAGRTVLTK